MTVSSVFNKQNEYILYVFYDILLTFADEISKQVSKTKLK